MTDTAIVTAVTGNYDHAWSGILNPDIDHLFFTDGPERPGWTTVLLPESNLDPRRRSKQPKLNPHSLSILRDYKYVIWIDGGIEILNYHFADEIKSYLKNGLVVSPHFSNTTIRQEAEASGSGKYKNEPIAEQVQHYLRIGFPDDLGVYECGVQARDMTASGVEDLGIFWHNQNLEWSFQDQVSFPYVLWQTKFQPDVLPQSFRYMGWVAVHAHRSDDY